MGINVFGIKLGNENFWKDLKDLSAEKMIEKYGIEIHRGIVEDLRVTKNGDRGANKPVVTNDPDAEDKLFEILEILMSKE